MEEIKRDKLIAKCVGLLCASKGKPFDPDMADAWTVILSDEPALRPFLLKSTSEAIKASKWVTVHDIIQVAQDYAKEARRAANQSLAPRTTKSERPPATPAQRAKWRARLNALFGDISKKMDLNSAMYPVEKDDEHAERVRRQVAEARSGN